jgi:AraC-like DNA-binding protein
MAYSEVILRTAGVLVLLTLAALMLASRRRDHTPALGAIFAVAVAAFVVTSARGSDVWLGGWLYPLTALCVGKAAFFWLFSRGLFADAFRLRPGQTAVIGVTVAYGSWQQLVYDDRSRLGLAVGWEHAAAAGFEAWVLGLVLLGLAEAYRGLQGDLVERRRRLRIVFVAAVAVYLVAAVLMQGYNLIQETRTPSLLVTANLALIATGALAALWNLVQLRAASWLDPEPTGAPPDALTALERRVLTSLREQLETHRIYREEGLTIGALAKRLGTREHVLRRVINQGLGYRNFNAFLHAHRIREACERLCRAEDARLPVLSIALSVGYSSIGPFNRAFRAHTGMTPTLYRRNGNRPGAHAVT